MIPRMRLLVQLQVAYREGRDDGIGGGGGPGGAAACGMWVGVWRMTLASRDRAAGIGSLCVVGPAGTCYRLSSNADKGSDTRVTRQWAFPQVPSGTGTGTKVLSVPNARMHLAYLRQP